MWSRHQRLVDFHLYTSPCLNEETEANEPPEPVYLHVTRCLLSSKKYLKQVRSEEEFEVLENGEDVECPSYSDEETLKGELTSDHQKLANRLSTIALGDFDLSSDSDASEGGKPHNLTAATSGSKSIDDRLKKYLDSAASLNGIKEESPDLTSEEKELNEDWEASDNSALMEAMGLPLNFGRAQPKKSKKSKLTEKEIRKKFTNLWEQHGELMVYKSFVSIYPDYAGCYDEITGSIPPCIEIEITDENRQYTSETIYYSEHPNGSNTQKDYEDTKGLQERNCTDSQAGDDENEVHSSEGVGDAPVILNKTYSNKDEIATESVASNNLTISDSGDLNALECKSSSQCSSEILQDASISSKDGPETSQGASHEETCNEPTNIFYSASYCYSQPRSLLNRDHCYGVNQNNANVDHGYCAVEENGSCGNDIADEDSHNDATNENEDYSHEELISILRGTHDDLKNQIYWHVKETVTTWYQDHPNQKFNLASLDEDLCALAQPYLQQADQWEQGEEFEAGEEYYAASQDDGDDEEEELRDGSYTGEEIYGTLATLGLAVSTDADENNSNSRKRKIVHGTVCVRRKNIIRSSRHLDFGRETIDQEDLEIPVVAKHFIFDDEGDAVEIETKPGFDREEIDLEDEMRKKKSKGQKSKKKPPASAAAPPSENAEDLPGNDGCLLCSHTDCRTRGMHLKGKRLPAITDPTHIEIFKKDRLLKKYWIQRYVLFSRFDEGIKMDRDSWFSVTPEPIAAHIAKRLECKIVIDGFCGAGGNTIQFAKVCEKVIAVDINLERLEIAKHNAQIYGVADKIEFIHGDFLELASSLKGDVVYLSPPWGGPSYLKKAVYDLDDMAGFTAKNLYQVSKQISNNVAFTLPRNCDSLQLMAKAMATVKQTALNTKFMVNLEGGIEKDAVAAIPGKGQRVEYEQVFLNDRLKMVTVYFGDLTAHIPEKYYQDTVP